MFVAKNYKQAQVSFEECLYLMRQIYRRNDDCVLTTMNNLAYSYLLGHEYEKCIELTEQIIKSDHSPTAFKNYENLLGIGVFSKDSLLVRKNLPKAYEGTLNHLTSHFLFLSSDQREQFIDENTGLSNLALPALFFPNDKICTAYAYNTALSSKGLLLNTTREIGDIAEKSDDAEIKSLYDRLKETGAKLDLTNDSIAIERLNSEHQSIEKALMNRIRSFQDFTQIIRTTWQDVRKSISPNTTAVEFITVDKSVLLDNDTTEYYCAVLVRKEWDAPKFVLLSKKQETDQWIKKIVSSFNDGNGIRGPQWRYMSNQLYKQIWKPIESYFPVGDSIYFSPIDMLCLAPIEALISSEGNTLDEKYTLHRLTSTRELCNQKSTSNNGEVILYGGLTYESSADKDRIILSGKERQGWKELPATESEVQSISKLYSDKGVQAKIYSGEMGTEESFKELSKKNIQVLHLATHGFYFREVDAKSLHFLRGMASPSKEKRISPLKRTGLMLSGGQAAWLGLNQSQTTNDGILMSSEIQAMEFHKVNLVVLSACQTGLGDISDDGIVGLQRAFKMAGAKTLIMTLWKVDDKATSTMMSNFYQELLNGKSANEAFSIAKGRVKALYVDPFFWAPFVMLD